MNARHALCLLVSTAALIPLASPAGPASSQTASLGLTSTREKGTVSLMTDPALSDRRLIFKVAAQNRAAQPATLNASDVKVVTAAGKAVALVPLSELIDEVRGSNRGSDRRSSSHQPSNYSRPGTTTGSRGQIDVSGGLTGAGDVASRTMAEVPRSAPSGDPAIEQQVQALNAAILQSLTIAPGQASGGQLVTERVKFGRKDERVLRVTVDFNGEQHEFSFEAPPQE